MKNAVFWDVMPLLFTAKVSGSPILVILTIWAILSPETSVLTRATRCHITEDGIPHITLPSYPEWT
jgi:hypothetical protein